MNISLGYEISTGRRVTIPVNHTVVLGQTQLSGKTTTLEAMVTRSGLRAIGFITKPGEKSFRQQTSIPAFFSESTMTDYWKYVVSIVENLMSVKLGWQERGWIMKLCQDYKHEHKEKSKQYSYKAPKTLQALLKNVEVALPHLRGTAEMICMQLREYLNAVVREISHTEFSSKLDLQTGINVMDVTELSDGLKALVIRSVIEQVHKHGRKTVIIIPEAWKFIPEGRSTPVKLALEGLIREGAGVGNFVWMDSQDLRGVDKLLLRSVIVWLFGVQRQKNEVASTLASIPDHPKPTATEVMQLGKGEFFVAYGSTLLRTYVQPAGMEDAHAQAIARGEESPESWKQIARALDAETETKEQEQEKTIREASPEAARGLGADVLPRDERERPLEGGDSGTSEAHGGVEGGQEKADNSAYAGPLRVAESRVTSHESPVTGVDAMWQERYNELKKNYDLLVETHDALARRLESLYQRVDASIDASQAAGVEENPSAGALTPPDRDLSAPAISGENRAERSSPSALPLTKEERNALYRYIVDRAQRDPALLKAMVQRPELRVTVQRQTIDADGGSLRGALALLIAGKFFDSPQNGNAAFNELKRLGRAVAKPNVYRELDKLAEMGFVTKEDTGYHAVPGMKIQIVETEKAAAAR